MIPAEYQRTVAFVYGQTGSGKTILARAVLCQLVHDKQARGLVLDTVKEHVDLPLISVDNVRAWAESEHTRGTMARVWCDTEDHVDLLATQLEEAEHPDGPVVLMVDEVSMWTNPNHSTPGLSRIIRYGRHWQVDLVCVARRPAETSRELTSQRTVAYYVGRVVEPRDLMYVRQTLCEEAVADIEDLARYWYVRVDADGSYQVCLPVKMR